eukprot:Blabericola_migrator_1__6187@NODE_3121_length_2023_cov_48_682515_g1955_i0_p1_GENE_NODE_3121_length_2023_cov_48_682515_g1955_i0NODE_3121_length_2023_cov_48_682515_g1955_i0_p1_ORF_typecomplete_len407_score47_59Pkinase/PF00069_25/0_011Pkinase/PF00069_25/3_9Kinaselike/PF14531_6/0_015Kinaselike/PF14531_6/11Kdo/PF06293_14/0_09Pkinase_Tyr/PF07714_17/21Pkinase_Tyr/PF07714_17/11_NODE_3121_length_2023_cov_48_682515_g1955_i02541474
MQVTKIIYNFHCHKIVHRDIKVEHFSFRTPPTPISFGEIVLTDVSEARFQKPHNIGLGIPYEMSSKVPVSLRREPSHPCVALHGEALEWQYLAESLLEEYSSVFLGESSGCMHWPVAPPKASSTPMTVAPEIEFCNSNKQCPTACRAEALCERATQKQRLTNALSVRCSLTPRSQDVPSTPSSRTTPCSCPLCSCHESRCDVWSLGLLLGSLFQVFENEVPRVDECAICGQRRKFNDSQLEMWLCDVTTLIETIRLTRNNLSDFSDASEKRKESPAMGTRATSVHDLCRPKSSTMSWLTPKKGDFVTPYVMGNSPKTVSTQASTPSSVEVMALNEQLTMMNKQSQWRDISELVKGKVLDALYWSTELNPSHRVSLLYLKDTFEMLFNMVYDFYEQLRLPHIFPTRS